ncbi:MAG: hypothetical protein LKI59_09475 [Bacteroidales bacterium]|jgi:hypothetical protein|nr:hypothetical protein [Bacteroidales bacterium]
MNYTSAQVNNMTYEQWMEAIAKELNDAGFKARGYNQELQKWQDNYVPYVVGDPKDFFLGGLRDVEALDYLKSVGLINNGRCPMCGNPIKGHPGSFTSGYNPAFNFQICQNCANEGKSVSVNPANSSGCLVALLLIPWNLIKIIFTSVINSM